MDEINSPKWKIKTFKRYGIISPRTTPTGKPSFTAGKTGWMGTHEHWLPSLIATASKYDAAACRFLQGHILDHIIGGRITPKSIHFAPRTAARNRCGFPTAIRRCNRCRSAIQEIGPLIRRVFLPEKASSGPSPTSRQQEFRMLVHFAEQHNLPGAKEAGDNYRNNPEADYHKFVAEMTGLDRDMAKPSISPRSTAAAQPGSRRKPASRWSKRRRSWRNTTPGCRS